MHILYLPRLYPHKYDPMWGLFVKHHAMAASKYNEISVLYIYPVDHMDREVEYEEESNNNINTLYIYFKKPNSKLYYFYLFIKYFFIGFNQINKKKKIDLNHVHVLSRMGFLAFISKIIHRKEYVITEHWSRYLPSVNTYNGSVRKLLTRLIVKNAKAVLPVTQNLKNAMVSHKLFNANYKIIANVVGAHFFNSKIQTQPKQLKRFIHVSTFINKSKNITGIVEGILTLSKTRQDFKLVLIGEGENYEDIINMVNEYKLKDFIEFTGMLEKEALVHEFEKASFLLINSNYENMPVVINEAMACGLPVLSTNVGGISEHLTSERGVLIEPNQPKQLVEQLNYMLDHSNKFDSSKIKQYALDHFSMEAIGKELNLIYKDALTK